MYQLYYYWLCVVVLYKIYSISKFDSVVNIGYYLTPSCI